MYNVCNVILVHYDWDILNWVIVCWLHYDWVIVSLLQCEWLFWTLWRILFFSICLIGERLMSLPGDHHGSDNVTNYSDGSWCNNVTDGVIHERYCDYDNLTSSYTCDSYWDTHSNSIRYIAGIPGMASNVIKGISHAYIRPKILKVSPEIITCMIL